MRNACVGVGGCVSKGAEKYSHFVMHYRHRILEMQIALNPKTLDLFEYSVYPHFPKWLLTQMVTNHIIYVCLLL